MSMKKGNINKRIRKEKINQKEMTLSLHRTEALFDGILAIAMTLLVLDIKIPNSESITNSMEFLQTLKDMHLTFIKYFTSFFILASIWIANNRELHFLEKTDHTHMWLNMYCMFFIVLIPFTTSVQDDFSSIPFAIIIFHLNIFFVELFILLRWLYLKGHQSLIKKGFENERLLKKQIHQAIIFVIITLIAVVSTYLIHEYSNLLYLLFFITRKMQA
ncbi:MAG: TMEM175 family protein [Bacteroidota bacterium]